MIAPIDGRPWLFARAALAAVVFIAGLIGLGAHRQLPESANPGIGLAVIVAFQLVAWPIMLLLVLGLQAINPFSARTWEYPRWSDNPFRFSQPLRFFHMAIFTMAAAALGTSLSALWRPVEPVMEIGAPLGMAGGLWLGLQAVWRVYAWKHRSPSPQNNEMQRTSHG